MDNSHNVRFRNGQNLLPLGIGTWNMGINPLKEREETQALLCGIDLGMTMIDTAEMFNNEEFLGKTLNGVRDKTFIVSKVLPSNASYKNTIKACETSLKKLNTDHIDLYLLHWKGSYALSETVKAMNLLEESGKISMWGVSNLDIDDMRQLIKLPGGNKCAVNQVLYNLKERGIEYDLLPWLQKKRIPTIAYSPLANGQLEENPLICEIARKYNVTPSQVILAWTVRKPQVMAVPRVTTLKHMKENFESMFLKLEQDDLDKIDNVFNYPRKKVPMSEWYKEQFIA